MQSTHLVIDDLAERHILRLHQARHDRLMALHLRRTTHHELLRLALGLEHESKDE